MTLRLGFVTDTAQAPALVKAQVQANDILTHNLLAAAAAYTTEYAALTGQHLTASSVGISLGQTRFTDDPGAASLAAAVPARLRASVLPALPTLYDLAPLNLLLRMTGERPVTA